MDSLSPGQPASTPTRGNQRASSDEGGRGCAGKQHLADPPREERQRRWASNKRINTTCEHACTLTCTCALVRVSVGAINELQ
eukprot:6887330-Alexandrium_andersonii.AAC.1